jgi:uncharacterized protein (UPF0212 family)
MRKGSKHTTETNFEPDETSSANLWSLMNRPQTITFAEGLEWVEIEIHGNNKCPICKKPLVPVAAAGNTNVFGFCTKCDKAFQYMSKKQ